MTLNKGTINMFAFLSLITGFNKKEIHADWWFFKITHEFNDRRPNPFKWLQNFLDVPPKIHQEQLNKGQL